MQDPAGDVHRHAQVRGTDCRLRRARTGLAVLFGEGYYFWNGINSDMMYALDATGRRRRWRSG